MWLCNKCEGNFSMISIQWMMMILTTMLIVEAYDRKFEILGKYENSSPSSVSFGYVNCFQTTPTFSFSAKLYLTVSALCEIFSLTSIIVESSYINRLEGCIRWVTVQGSCSLFSL